jgi:flagellar motility protein MotE (MotC chaperone)
LAFLTTKGLATLPQHERDQQPSSRYAANTEGTSWAFFNPEMEQLMTELRSERDALAAKEKQLNELSSRLRTERAELDDALKAIKKLQQQVDRDIYRIKEDEAANLKKLSKMYASMEPAGAAKILRELDDIIVVKILGLMKEAETGLILESMSRLGETETRRAASISENLRAATVNKPAAKP